MTTVSAWRCLQCPAGESTPDAAQADAAARRHTDREKHATTTQTSDKETDR